MKIGWHRHAWWLVGAEEYAREGAENTAAAWTLLTYVCRGDHSHTKQVQLQGRHYNTVVQAIFTSQKRRVEKENIPITEIPDVYKRAWETETP